jgi:hypothetical protein
MILDHVRQQITCCPLFAGRLSPPLVRGHRLHRGAEATRHHPVTVLNVGHPRSVRRFLTALKVQSPSGVEGGPKRRSGMPPGGPDVCSRCARSRAGTIGTVGQGSRAERYPHASCATSESPQPGSEPSTGAECTRSIAPTSLGVAGRMEGHPNAFSKQTNCFSSPSARRRRSFLDRRKPARKCRLKECSPGETWYTLVCSGEMTPIFELSSKTLTTPRSPIPALGRWRRPRPSRDAARTTTRVGNAGQIRFGARHNWMVAPTSSLMPRGVSSPLVAAAKSDLSRSWFMVLSYTDRRQKNSSKAHGSRPPRAWPPWRPNANSIGAPYRRLGGEWPTRTRGAAFSSDDGRVDE